MAQTTAFRRAVERFSDWRWRLDNLYWITDERGRRLMFRMNWAQERLFAEMHTLNVILKARQLGFTTFIQLFMLDACVFNSNVRAGTIAHTLGDAEEIFKDKVKYPYENLPAQIRAANPAVEDSTRKLSFANNSSLRVGTSLRSGTFQYLHVSEFGKLCARYPDKAKEVKTGAFNTVHPGQVIWVESTAEGQEGAFFEMTETAQALARQGAALTPLDFKFFFFPWWQHPGYALAPEGVAVTAEDAAYFDKLAGQGIRLTARQKAWYVKKAAQQRDDMKREFPSLPEEAFAASVEGAYYGALMARCEAEGRICELPLEPGVPVDTWWDLGMNDLMAIAWVQRAGPWVHVVDYYENSGEGLGHYAQVLQERQRARGLVYGEHAWPHDGNARILDEKGRQRTEVMRDLGYRVSVVERGLVAEGIEAVRALLPRCRFDAARCAPLVRALKNYRKEWDDQAGVFKTKPLHNWASHAADMVRTGAMLKRREAVEMGGRGRPRGGSGWMGA